MPFQPINFAAIPVQGDPGARGLSDALANMFKTGKDTFYMLRDAEKERTEQQTAAIQNALNQYKVQEEPQRFQNAAQAQAFKSALEQQQANKIRTDLANPMYGLPGGDIGQVIGIEKIGQTYGYDSPQYKSAKQTYDANLQGKKTLNTVREGYIEANKLKPFNSLPAQEKERMLASAVSLGYEPLEAAKLLSQGNTLEKLGQDKGINLADTTPSYALTQASKSQLQQRSGFRAEIDSLSKNISAPLASYGNSFFAIKPDLVMDQISGENPDKQARILAARALVPELNGIRMKSLGGTPGVGVLREMKEGSLNNLKVFDSLVSDDVRKKMYDYMDQWIEQGGAAYENNLLQKSSLGRKSPSHKNIPPPFMKERSETTSPSQEIMPPSGAKTFTGKIGNKIFENVPIEKLSNFKKANGVINGYK